MTDEPPIIYPDPPPAAPVVLLPGDGKTFFLNDHVYRLSKSNQVLEDDKPLPDGYGMGQVVFVASTLYCQDIRTLTWYRWDGMLHPSDGPGSVDDPKPVSHITAEDAAKLIEMSKSLMDQLATVIVTTSRLIAAIEQMIR
jgi:hypothetical protein